MSRIGLALLTGCTWTSTGETEEPEVELTPIESLQKSCEAGEAEPCAELAAHFLSGDGVDKDPARAAELYSQSCGGGFVDACLSLADQHDAGEGLPRDAERASELIANACDAGSLEACARLAARHLKALGVPADADRAVDLYKQACSGGHGASCRHLSQMFAVGAHVPRDTDQSLSYAKAGCGRDDTMSCCRLAQHQILAGKDRDARSTLDALLKKDPELEEIDPLIVHGLRVAAGEKPEKVGSALLDAWRTSQLSAETWSWHTLTEHLADEKRKKSQVSRIVIELLDAPRADGTEAALAAALGVPE